MVRPDDVGAGGNHIGLVEQCIGEGDGQFVDLTTKHDVAEVDDATHDAAVDQHVAVVGVVVHHRSAQVRDDGHDTVPIPLERLHDEVVVGAVHDVSRPRFHLQRVVEMPQEVGAERARVIETGQRAAEAPHRGAERSAQLGGGRRVGVQPAGQPADHPHEVSVPAHVAGRDHPWHRHVGRDGREVIEHRLLQAEHLDLLGCVRHLQHHRSVG